MPNGRLSIRELAMTGKVPAGAGRSPGSTSSRAAIRPPPPIRPCPVMRWN